MKFLRTSTERKQKSLRATDTTNERGVAVPTTDSNPARRLTTSNYGSDVSLSDGKGSDSDSTGISKAKSTMGSVANTTVSTCGCSSRSKKVRFDVVEIRHYERIASDNPCCSSGPPIGIGWNFIETQKSKVNDYEESRGDRKFYLDTVLSRSEREHLLLEWGVNMRTMAASVRAATKTKFQRKQTVINTRKLTKLEKVIDITFRQFKKIVLTREHIDHEVESVATTSAENFESDSSAEYIKSLVTETDEESSEKLIKNVLDLADECNEDNISTANSEEFSLGATTLGATSTYSPSIIEIEKFYEELERELFGESDDLPSMLGQTLEVPEESGRNITKLNNNRTNDVLTPNEMHSEATSRSHPDTENLLLRYPRDESQNASYHDGNLIDAQNRSYTYHDPNSSMRGTPHQYHSIENHYVRGTSQPLHAVDDESHPIATSFHREYNDPTIDHSSLPCVPIHRQTISSFQNGINQHYTQYNNGYIEDIDSQQYNHSHFCREQNGSSNTQFSLHTEHQQRYPDSYHQPLYQPTIHSSSVGSCYSQYNISNNHNSFSAHGDSNFDGPQVYHMPLHGPLTADQWMDGTDRACPCCNVNSVVTITEGD